MYKCPPKLRFSKKAVLLKLRSKDSIKRELLLYMSPVWGFDFNKHFFPDVFN